MTAALPRKIVAGLGLLALSTSAAANAAPAAGQRHDLRVIVHDCYTSTAVEIWIDGAPLALAPPERRDDTVAVCYEGAVSLGPQAEVRLRSAGDDRRIALEPTEESRFLLITPGRPPYAVLARDVPLVD
jgi:hypothetical protein